MDLGDKSPLFLLKTMRKKEEIINIVEKAIEEPVFLVDLQIEKGQKINVFVDTMKGITIDQCKQINRDIEEKLDREKEDFELSVASPGLHMPLKLTKQYIKNIGQQVEVLVNDGRKETGKLLSVDEEKGVELEVDRQQKEGKKKKWIKETIFIEFEHINSTKIVVSF